MESYLEKSKQVSSGKYQGMSMADWKQMKNPSKNRGKKQMNKPKKTQMKAGRPAQMKFDKKAWWRSKTAEEQADYIYGKMLEEGKNPNWDEIYTGVIARGLYRK